MIEKPEFSDEYQQRSLAVLTQGLSEVPAYASWRNYDTGENRPVDERYAALPELTKKEMRENFPSGFVPPARKVEDGLKSGELEIVETNGTTEEKVKNLWNQAWWNASEAASWKLNSATRELDGTHREALLTSALSVGVRSPDELPMSDRILGRFLFLNEKDHPGQWNAAQYERMAGELETFAPQVLEANPSYLARLAWWAAKHNVRLYQPRVIVLTFELPSLLSLRSIRHVFSCPLVSSYGSTETGYVFMQCEHGMFHQNTRFCRVDFQPFKKQFGGPALGRILVTPFQNSWTTLVRFNVGDLVRLSERGFCPCGRREGYQLSAIEGRWADATFSSEGKPVTPRQADAALASVIGLRDYQLEQTSAHHFLLRLLVSGDPHLVIRACRVALRAVYGQGTHIDMELRDELGFSASGKFRRVWGNRPVEIASLLA